VKEHGRVSEQRAKQGPQSSYEERPPPLDFPQRRGVPTPPKGDQKGFLKIPRS
jgi:hypothetical protein